MGVATTRYEERGLAKLGPAPAKFVASESVYGAGVLFLIPSLLSQGLLKTKQVYTMPANDYYSVESIVLTLAIMALSRIKTPEQLKLCKPGELGKLIGLDRIPEVKCLRKKIKLLSNQEQSKRLNELLIEQWYDNEEEPQFLYIDGHQRIYYGHKANLPVKYISRQKLCLSATSEYWVHDMQGMPVMMVMGELSEKLKDIIRDQIIPRLQQTVILEQPKREEGQPVCTLIFDREAYEPAFFESLWLDYQIAVITYRKNVKDNWAEDKFKQVIVTVLSNDITMHLCEQKVVLNKCSFREVRRLNDSGHQTSIITNHPRIKASEIAGKMFGRWSQENFFKYMIADYNFDKMIEYGIQEVEPTLQVVNPEYRKLNNQVKKIREKKARIQAKFYPLVDQVIDQHIDEIPKISKSQEKLVEKIQEYEQQEASLLELCNKLEQKITVQQMPDNKRYNKLKHESKKMMNIIKMICYRAESSLANLITQKLNGKQRMCIKQLIKNNADIIPDYTHNTLTVVLHAMSAKRYNDAINELLPILKASETIFPGTNLKMIFKTTAL